MQRAILYTDGSCGKNKDGGWACLINKPSFSAELYGWEENTTNNRMEMFAAINGLQYLKTPHIIFLASDSAYMLNALKNGWYIEWLRGGNRKNLDLWRMMENLAKFHKIETIKVKGHGTDLMNVKVDGLAVQARIDKVSSLA